MSDAKVKGSSKPVPLPQPGPCTANKIKNNLVYSRGNADPDEMIPFYNANPALGKYVYETARYDLVFNVNPKCLCEREGCTGNIDIKLDMTINMRTDLHIEDPLVYSLVPGPDPKRCTVEKDPSMTTPRHNVNLTLPKKVKLPQPVQGNKFEKVVDRFFKARAATKVSCKAGTYCKRFYVVATDDLYSIDPITLGEGYYQLVLVVDCQVNVMVLKPCVLNIEFQAFLIEVITDKDIFGGLDLEAELPKIEYEMDGVTVKTWGVAKFISEDGEPRGVPFPPKTP